MVLQVLSWLMVVLAFVGAGVTFSIPSTGWLFAAVFMTGIVIAAVLHGLANVVEYLELIAEYNAAIELNSQQTLEVLRRRTQTPIAPSGTRPR